MCCKLLSCQCYQASLRRVALTTQLVHAQTLSSEAMPAHRRTKHHQSQDRRAHAQQHTLLTRHCCHTAASFPPAMHTARRSWHLHSASTAALSAQLTRLTSSLAATWYAYAPVPRPTAMPPHATCTVAAPAAAICCCAPRSTHTIPARSAAATVTFHKQTQRSCQQLLTRPPTSAGLQHLAAPWP